MNSAARRVAIIAVAVRHMTAASNNRIWALADGDIGRIRYCRIRIKVTFAACYEHGLDSSGPGDCHGGTGYVRAARDGAVKRATQLHCGRLT